jgi:heme-degrading monooxygenase HmoA
MSANPSMMARWTVALLATLASGCADDASGMMGEAQQTGGAHAQLYACDEGAFQEIRPLSGPGFDAATGIVGPARERYLVSTTMLYWKPGMMETFYEIGGRVMAQVGESPGLVAFAVGTDETCRVARAITVWESEEAMIAFAFSGAHGEAVGMFHELADTGKKAHWYVSADELTELDWDAMRSRLRQIEPPPGYR